MDGRGLVWLGEDYTSIFNGHLKATQSALKGHHIGGQHRYAPVSDSSLLCFTRRQPLELGSWVGIPASPLADLGQLCLQFSHPWNKDDGSIHLLKDGFLLGPHTMLDT